MNTQGEMKIKSSSLAYYSKMVPANLLIAGEYSILLDGNLGLSMSLDVYLKIDAKLNDLGSFRIFSKANSKTTSKEGFFSFSREILKEMYIQFPQTQYADFIINSTDFFYEDGEKKGFGSSACVFVALLSAFQKIYKLDLNRVNYFMKSNYRKLKGGFASAYDCLTSYWGYDLGLFRQSDNPIIENTKLPFDFCAYTFRGPNAVKSEASAKFFLERKHELENLFFQKSNSLIENAVYAKSFLEFAEILNEIKYHYKAIKKMGIENEIELPNGNLGTHFFKNSGAGNEVGILLFQENNNDAKKFVQKHNNLFTKVK